jgi:hypothetical protein
MRRYRKSLDIEERLAVADPANSVWQRDLIVSYVKFVEARYRPFTHFERALKILRSLDVDNRLKPVDSWMIEDLQRRIGQATE